MVWIVGGVLSQSFTALAQLWGPVAFHAICTGLGVALLGKASTAKAAARTPLAGP